jgi:hypothetical protein
MDEMFYTMHVLTLIITCTFIIELKVQESNFGSYMRTGVMEDAQGSYNNEEEIIGLHVIMGNAETNSNGRRDMHELVTMRSLYREVKSYMDGNERIMKSQEEILQSLNMLHKQVNKDSGTKKAVSARQVSASRSQRKRDEHGNDRQSRSMTRHHHSPRKSTRRTHASLGPGSNPSVSPIWRQRRRPGGDILQGELMKIKPPTFNGEHRKGEDGGNSKDISKRNIFPCKTIIA